MGRLDLFDCSFTGNYANTTGGAISSTGSGSISGCTFRDNSAGSHGGGGISVYGGALTITDSTIVDNSTSGPGGGIHVYAGTLTAVNDTISDNSASSGGGIASDPGTTLTIANTIVAGNTATTSGPDVLGSFGSQGTNLIGATDGSTGWVGSDLTGTTAQPLDAMLAPLGNYGGPTETMALLPGSPAIGAGTPISGITTDQRGFARPASNPDIGAFQTQGSTLVVNTTADGTVSGPGQLTLRQAVNIDNMLSTAEPITFSSLFNTPQTITLTGGQLELSNTNGTEAIAGPGANLLTVSGGGTQGVFQVDTDVTASLADLTIADGVAADGGGVYSVGNLTVTGDVFIGNTAKASGPYGYPAAGGGAIFSINGTLVVSNSTFTNNQAPSGGGGAIEQAVSNYENEIGSLTVSGSAFSGNVAEAAGAIQDAITTMNVSNSTFTSNRGTLYAGAIDNGSSNGTLTNCTFTSNSAPFAGAINNFDAGGLGGSLTLTGCTFTGNTATNGNGGTIYSSLGQGHRILNSTHEENFFTVVVVARAFHALDLDAFLTTGLALEEAKGEPPNHAQVGRGMVAAYAAFILPETDVQLPVEIVLDAPMTPDGNRELLDCD